MRGCAEFLCEKCRAKTGAVRWHACVYVSVVSVCVCVCDSVFVWVYQAASHSSCVQLPGTFARSSRSTAEGGKGTYSAIFSKYFIVF